MTTPACCRSLVAMLGCAALVPVASPAQIAPDRAAGQSASSARAGADTSARSDGEVVVRGDPGVPAPAALSRAITPRASMGGTLGRFLTPVCFGVAGLARPMLVTVVNRLVDDAEQAGIPRAIGKCDPNVVVWFADDSRAATLKVRQRYPWVFGDANLNATRAMSQVVGPAHVWNAGEWVSSGTGSHLKAGSARRFVHSVVIIDRRAVVGHTLTEIADYAAMRAFAMTLPERASGGDTILTLFDRADHPAGMTAFDRHYLKALYAGSGDDEARLEVKRIARAVAGKLAADAPR